MVRIGLNGFGEGGIGIVGFPRICQDRAFIVVKLRCAGGILLGSLVVSIDGFWHFVGASVCLPQVVVVRGQHLLGVRPRLSRSDLDRFVVRFYRFGIFLVRQQRVAVNTVHLIVHTIVRLCRLLHHLDGGIVVLCRHVGLGFFEQSIETANLRVLLLNFGILLVDLLNLLLLFLCQLRLLLLTS